MTVKTIDDFRTNLLVLLEHLSQVFRIELGRKGSRFDNVNEHHRELAAFGFRRGRGGWNGLALRRRDVRCGRWMNWRGGGWCAGHLPGPDEHLALFIHRQLFGVYEVSFQVFKGLIIELQPALEYPIGNALLLLQQRQHLGQDRIVVHHRSSTCASTASAWGSQNVMSIDWYISMAVVNAVQTCSRWPVMTYNVPRPRWQCAWSGRMPSSSARVRACW